MNMAVENVAAEKPRRTRDPLRSRAKGSAQGNDAVRAEEERKAAEASPVIPLAPILAPLVRVRVKWLLVGQRVTGGDIEWDTRRWEAVNATREQLLSELTPGRWSLAFATDAGEILHLGSLTVPQAGGGPEAAQQRMAAAMAEPAGSYDPKRVLVLKNMDPNVAALVGVMQQGELNRAGDAAAQRAHDRELLVGLFESFAKGLTAAVTNAGGGGRDQGMSNEARTTIAALERQVTTLQDENRRVRMELETMQTDNIKRIKELTGEVLSHRRSETDAKVELVELKAKKAKVDWEEVGGKVIEGAGAPIVRMLANVISSKFPGTEPAAQLAAMASQLEAAEATAAQQAAAAAAVPGPAVMG